MELSQYFHIARNKWLFNYGNLTRPTIYKAFKINHKPIIVLGNQKSGTSAIAALLAKATGCSYDIDLGGFRTTEYDALHNDKCSFMDLVQRRAKIEFSKDIVKEPNITFLYDEVYEAFPQAKFVIVVRNPFQNIRSTLNRLNLPGNQAQLSAQQIGQLSSIWKSILYNKWIGDSTRVLNYVGRSAERWQNAINTYRTHQHNITLVKYEDFVQDKVQYINALALNLALPVVSDITNKVDIQFQGKGNTEINLPLFFGQNYEIISKECESGIKYLYPNLLTNNEVV